MIMSNHTPGPWSVGRSYPDGDRALDIWSVRVHHGPSNNQGNCLAMAYNGTRTGKSQAIANANLIAAAPEMFEFIEYLANLPCECCGCLCIHTEAKTLLKRLNLVDE